MNKFNFVINGEIMKDCLFLLVFVGAIFATHASESNKVMSEGEGKPFATFNEKYFGEGKFNEDYFGELGAVTGKIVDINEGPNGRFIYTIKLSRTGNELAVGNLKKIVGGHIQVGDSIDALGFFDHTVKDEKYVKNITKAEEYMIALCLNVHSTGLPVFYNKTLEQCLQWQGGEVIKLEL